MRTVAAMVCCCGDVFCNHGHGRPLTKVRIPVVTDVHTKTLEMIESRRWDNNICGTTHCRAGWAVVLGGKAGIALEKMVGTCKAAELIMAASTLRAPISRDDVFYTSNENALKDIRRCADAEASLHLSERARKR